MKLKRVKLFGFKTFADKTEFDLRGGTIAIVGPNGCGKSNLVDAMLWGLGEGNARQLRTQTGQDVIFGGSANRKPLGYAEVSLLFDNEDGSLPISASEVEITRRLSRSGDSDYRINGRSCRLRDIHELLADSGLGRAGYSIVGQKEIDQALAASPEDRRAWIDEAAGVQRYRARKTEAQRRLASAHQHLERVGDILTEIETQIGPLEGEAEVARKYKTIIGALQEVESNLLIVEVVRAAAEVAAANERAMGSQKLASGESNLAEKLEKDSRTKQERARTLSIEADRVREALAEAQSNIQKAETQQRLAVQRLESLDEIEGSLFGDSEAGAKRIEAAKAEKVTAEKEADDELKALEAIQTEAAGSGAEAAKLREALKEIDIELAKARQTLGERVRREAEAAHAETRRKDIRRELKGIDATLPDLEKGVEEARAETAKQVAIVTSKSEKINQVIVQVNTRKAEEGEVEGKRRLLLADIANAEGRKAAMEATIEAHEGLPQGSRAVLALVSAGKLIGKYVPVGEAISVSPDVAMAIETALGPHTHDLIVNGPEEAKVAIEVLKEERLGRATFQPISLMRPDLGGSDLRDMLNRPGVVGRASDLIRCEAHMRPVIETLLGRVIIVETLDDALKFAKTGGWNRLVTLDGEIVHHRGGVTGGDSGRPTFGVVQRKAEIGKLESNIRKLSKELGDLTKQTESAGKEVAKLEKEIAGAQEQLRELRDEAEEAKSWLRQLEAELAETQKSRQRLKDEVKKLAGGDDLGETIDIAAIETRRDAALHAMAAKAADADAASTRLKEAEARVSQAQLRAELARRRLAAAIEAEEHRNLKATNIEPERKKLRAELEKVEKEINSAAREKEKAEAELEKRQNEKDKAHSEAMELLDKARTARFAAQTATEAAHKAELDRARAEARRATSAQRLLEDYGISESEAEKQAADIVLPDDAATAVARLRRELKGMGDVNLGAIEAYDRLSTRQTELSDQRADIVAGIKDVQASIAELDGLTRVRFEETFVKVREAFQNLFGRLFEGGSGDIRMADEDNLLDSGIEIDVTLPGKKRQRLEVLSGGERSLCATAFLFALLRVKPSPLVVLDEVDAPLDGRNVERYVELLKDFSRTVQFIVVTHNDITIKSTQTWVGVTMAEPGVSTLVPVRLPDTPSALEATHA